MEHLGLVRLVDLVGGLALVIRHFRGKRRFAVEALLTLCLRLWQLRCFEYGGGSDLSELDTEWRALSLALISGEVLESSE